MGACRSNKEGHVTCHLTGIVGIVVFCVDYSSMTQANPVFGHLEMNVQEVPCDVSAVNTFS